MKKERAAAVFLGFSLFAASSGITNAYLQDQKTVCNVVTTGGVKIDLTEPAWEPEQAEGLTPDSAVPKNPIVTNTGKTDAWIFLRVSVPVKNIILVEPQTRRKTESVQTELFAFTAGEDWELLEKKPEKDMVCYVYGFRRVVPPQDRTTPLFESVKLVNYLEGELTQEDVLDMPIEAAAIQDHVCPPGARLSEIYRVYLEQENHS